MNPLRLWSRYPVPIAFLALCAFFSSYAKLALGFVLVEMTNRLARNLVLTLSLVIPVVAGLGLNFGIVLGAMAGQAALILVRHWNVAGFPGFALALFLSTPIAVVLGWLVGELLNRAKGREMITGIIASFFAAGVYSLVFLFAVGSGHGALVGVAALGCLAYYLTRHARGGSAMGTAGRLAIGALFAGALVGLVSIRDVELVKPEGYGLRTSMNLDWSAKPATATAPARSEGKITGALDTLVALNLPVGEGAGMHWSIPVGTFLAVALICLAIQFLLGTKLGQEMRALGQDMHIAGVLGIGVDRTRLIAIVISTVLAAWGQLVFLQNMGTVNVYSSHDQVGMMAVAALLIGGASASEASIVHALAGTFLLHLLMLLSAAAGPNLFPNNPTGAAQLGEYVRSSAAYGVIALALALHAYKEARCRARELEG